MKSEYDFFIIEREHLKGKRLFPFQIYVFNPLHKKFSLFLNGNRPLTSELDQFLEYLLSKGGKLAVLKKQRRTFLTEQDYKEADIPSLATRELHELEKERIMYIKLKEMYDQKNGAFLLTSEFELAAETDNFEKIIEYARMDILTFSVTESATVSLAIHLAKTHLTKDNFINRIVATSVLVARQMKINDQNALSDIVCAAYLIHLGYSQLPLSLIKIPALSQFDKDKKLFQKHSILSHHLCKRTGLLLSERCKRIVYEHHERVDGRGFPQGLYTESIDPLSLIVGAVSHLFEFSKGYINGGKVSLKATIVSIKGKTFIPGLETEFGERVYNSLVSLINTDKAKKENELESDNITNKNIAA